MTNKRVTLVAKDGTEISGELNYERDAWYTLRLAAGAGYNTFSKQDWTLKRSLPTYDYAVVKITFASGSVAVLTRSRDGYWTTQSGYRWTDKDIEQYDWIELVEKGADQ